MIDILVPVLNQLKKTKYFIDSVRFQDYPSNLIIINNASNIETTNFLRSLNVTLIENNTNVGYVKAINQGIKFSKSDIICFSNNDIILPSGVLSLLIKKLEFADIVGPLSTKINPDSSDIRLIDFDMKDLNSLNSFFKKLKKRNAGILIDVNFLFGHFIIMKRSVIDKIGGLDNSFGMGNYDDVDFCKRASLAGFRVALAKDCFVHHYCHATFEDQKIDVNNLMKQNKIYFDKKWSEYS